MKKKIIDNTWFEDSLADMMYAGYGGINAFGEGVSRVQAFGLGFAVFVELGIGS